MTNINNHNELVKPFNNIQFRINITTSEAWVFQDKAILAIIDKGMTEANNGQLIDKGSFAKYINE